MHILVVGGDGTLGAALRLFYRNNGKDVLYTSRRDSSSGIYLDLKNHNTDMLPEGPGIAIMAASICAMNYCEQHPEETYEVNVIETQKLLLALKKKKYRPVFLSSNSVFDGKIPFPMPNDTPCPQSVYGQQKAEVERFLLQNIPQSLIVRLTKVIPHDFPLFLEWIKALKNNSVIQPFLDVYVAPVLLEDVCRTLHSHIQTNKSGICHISATEQWSYADIAYFFAKELSVSQKLVRPQCAPSTIKDYLRPPHVTLGKAENRTLNMKCILRKILLTA